MYRYTVTLELQFDTDGDPKVEVGRLRTFLLETRAVNAVSASRLSTFEPKEGLLRRLFARG